jgi:hypothetical protein
MKFLFAFIDAKDIPNYEKLGFNVEIDDAYNQVFYAEKDLSTADNESILAVVDDCNREGISVSLDYDGILRSGENVKDFLK